jgi:hypothetical protein
MNHNSEPRKKTDRVRNVSNRSNLETNATTTVISGPPSGILTKKQSIEGLAVG